MPMMLPYTFGAPHRSVASNIATMATWWRVGQTKGQSRAPTFKQAAATALKRWRGRATALAKRLGKNREDCDRYMWRMCNCTPSGIAAEAPGRTNPISCGSAACVWCAHRKTRLAALQILRTVDLMQRLALPIELFSAKKSHVCSTMGDAIFRLTPTKGNEGYLMRGAIGCRSSARLIPTDNGFRFEALQILFVPSGIDALSPADRATPDIRTAQVSDSSSVRNLLIDAFAYPTEFMFGNIDQTATVCRAITTHRKRWMKASGVIVAAMELFEAAGKLLKLNNEHDDKVDESIVEAAPADDLELDPAS